MFTKAESTPMFPGSSGEGIRDYLPASFLAPGSAINFK